MKLLMNEKGAGMLMVAMIVAALLAGHIIALSTYRGDLSEESRKSRKHVAAHKVSLEAASALRSAYDYYQAGGGGCQDDRVARVYEDVGFCMKEGQKLENPYYHGHKILLNDQSLSGLKVGQQPVSDEIYVFGPHKTDRWLQVLNNLRMLPSAHAEGQQDLPTLISPPSHMVAPVDCSANQPGCVRCVDPGRNADCVVLRFCLTPKDCAEGRMYRQVYGFLTK